MRTKTHIFSRARCFALLIACFLAFLSNKTNAQNYCGAALDISSTHYVEINTDSTYDSWVKFVAPTNAFGVSVNPMYPSGSSPATISDEITQVEIDTGVCSLLYPIATFTHTSGDVGVYNFAFNQGQTYYLKISNGCKCKGYYLVSLLTYGPSVCEANCNLSCNGNLDLTSQSLPLPPYVTNIGYAGCWNTFWDNTNNYWADMDSYGGPANGAWQGTPDYFNASATAPSNAWNYSMDIPSNFIGTQSSFSGTGYSGIYAYENWPGYFGSPLAAGNYGAYYREYLQQEMCDSMITGRTYRVTFHASLADASSISTYLGVLFTMDTIWQPDPPTGFPGSFFGAPYTAQSPQFESTSQLSNYTGWDTCTFLYTATSNYKHMAIGNFRLPSTGNQTQLNSNLFLHQNQSGVNDTLQVSYYYIDGISVVPADSIVPHADTIQLCYGDRDTLNSIFSGGWQHLNYTWTASPTDTSLTNWLAQLPALPDSTQGTVVVSPNTSTTYYVAIYDSLYHCTYNDTFYVHVNGVVFDSLIGNALKCDTLAQYIVYHHPNNTNEVYTWMTSTGDTIWGNGNDTITVNWAVSTGTNSWLYVVATDTVYGCTMTDSVFVQTCCVNDTGIVIYNDTSSVLFGAVTGPILFSHYNINGTFVIDQNIDFVLCNFNMGPNAKILVTGGHHVIFETDSVKAGCCEMWDAMEVNSVSDTLEISKFSYVGDGIRGVTSNNGGVYIIEDGVTFNRNYVSITVNPYAGYHGGLVRSSTFTSVQADYCPTTSGTLLPPHSGEWPLYGFFATGVDSIIIGDSTTTYYNYTNTFTNLRNGIRTEFSNPRIYNNRFIAIDKAGANSKAVWSRGRFPTISPLNFTQYEVFVGGINTVSNVRNVFIDCPFGVYTDTAMSTYVNGNLFDQQATSTTVGIAVRVNNCNGISRTVNVLSDTIYNHLVSVYLYQNNKSTNLIQGNYIERTTSGYLNCRGVYAICNGNNSGTITTYLNEMHGVQIGVQYANVKKGVVDNNFIYIRPTYSSLTPARAVWITNSVGVRVLDNQIWRESPSSSAITTNWVGGIYIANSTAAKVTCNVIHKLGYGIQVAGPVSTNGTVFRNEMWDTKLGIWLSNAAIIGSQGNSSGLVQDNTWSGAITSRVYTSGPQSTNGQYSPFFYRIGTNYYPGPSNNSVGSNPVTLNYVFGAGSTQACAYVQTPSDGTGQNGGIALAQIIFDSTNSTVQDACVWLSREGLYRLFEIDTTFAVGDTILQDFKDSADVAVIGKIVSALGILSEGSVTSYRTLVSTLNGVNNMARTSQNDGVYQYVTAVMLSHLIYGDTLSSTELDSLKSIAALCPYIDGNAVYIARGIIAPYDTTEYQNSCEILDSTGNRTGRPHVEDPAAYSTFHLYPNPSNGQVTVEYELQENETGTLEIYNTTGSLVYSIPLQTGQQVRKVTLPQLEAGVYLYKVSVNGELRLADRLIIIE